MRQTDVPCVAVAHAVPDVLPVPATVDMMLSGALGGSGDVTLGAAVGDPGVGVGAAVSITEGAAVGMAVGACDDGVLGDTVVLAAPMLTLRTLLL